MTQNIYVMLTADEGMVLTNGKVYGKIIVLGNGDSAENYREISDEEFSAAEKAGPERL